MIVTTYEMTAKFGHAKDAVKGLKELGKYLDETYPGYVLGRYILNDGNKFNSFMLTEAYDSLAKFEEFGEKCQDDEEYLKLFRAVLEHFEVYTGQGRILRTM